MRPQTIVLTLVTASVLAFSSMYAENRDKENCYEDAVEINGKLLRVKTDLNTGRVVYFWDDKAGSWADISHCPVDINKTYAENKRFREMQGELDRLRDETWDDRYRH